MRTALAALLALAAPISWAASAQLAVIHDFGTQLNDGKHSLSSMLLASDGNLYGTTESGGAFDGGTVFRVSPSGTVTVLYSFGSAPNDGLDPGADLVQADDGYLYGTTPSGGANAGAGTIFKISTLGAYLKLYDFGAFASDGTDPDAGLVQGPDGYLYGTTTFGGPYQAFNGTLFRISTAGAYSQVHAFGATPEEGEWPVSGLTVAGNGDLYGTTHFSGPRGQPMLQLGAGTVYKYKAADGISRLHEFGGADECPPDGAGPWGSLILGSDGNLYGTTRSGGVHDQGTVFRVTPTGVLTILYEFGSIPKDGREPASRLVRLANGGLLGTTRFGGAHESANSWGGTAFMLAPDGTYTLLHSFGATEDDPQFLDSGLTMGTDGNFYGTSVNGGSTADRANGTTGFGTVYRLVINPNGTAPTTKYVPQSCATNKKSSGGSGGLPLSVIAGLLLGLAARGRSARAKQSPPAG